MHGVVIEWRRVKELVASARTAIIVDLTAPSVSCTAPTSLRVGTAVTITPSATDTEIASYACKTDPSLPASLTLNGTSGMIGSTPSVAAAAGDVTIVITDDAGNTRDVTLSLPAVTEVTRGQPGEVTMNGDRESGELPSRTTAPATPGSAAAGRTMTGTAEISSLRRRRSLGCPRVAPPRQTLLTPDPPQRPDTTLTRFGNIRCDARAPILVTDPMMRSGGSHH